MYFTTIAVFIQLINLALLMLIPTAMGIYVYRDAKQRGMNAALWTIVAVFTPIFIGLIIYLLSRSSYSNLQCQNCASPVTEQYTVCPRCGIKLKATCPSCGFSVEEDWIVCPSCTTTLPTQQMGFYNPPIPKKDTAIGKLLLLVILVPILLIIVGLFSFASYRGTSLNTVSITSNNSTNSPAPSQEELYKDNQEVQAWLEKCDADPTKLYAFYYESDIQSGQATYYLVYWPTVNTDYSIRYNEDIQVYLTKVGTTDVNNNQIIHVPVYDPNNFMELQVFINGERVDFEITYANDSYAYQ